MSTLILTVLAGGVGGILVWAMMVMLAITGTEWTD
jgi:hypothetical protein